VTSKADFKVTILFNVK